MKTEQVSFDPADGGAAKAAWQVLLESRGMWQPRAGALVVVSPHPDDELLAAGGLIRQWALSGHPVTVLSVTDGERAYPNWAGLDVIRRRELTDGLRVLVPVHVAIRRVGIPDGKVASHSNRLRNALLHVLDETTTLVAPYEQDGHPDHDATGRVCLDVTHASQVSLVRYPIWAWHRRMTAMLSALSWAKYALNADTQRAKMRAIECFASQIKPPRGEPQLPANVLHSFLRPYEAFIV
jgi:LmbE family N-acetylglucosaminyl deacetylase